MGRVNFIATTINVGEIKMGSEDNPIDFEFEGDPREIVKVRPLCGCTADDAILGNRLQLRYRETITKDIPLTVLKEQYPEGYIRFDKNLEVYFNDGKDLHVMIEGVKRYNPDKDHVKLTFGGKIILDD